MKYLQFNFRKYWYFIKPSPWQTNSRISGSLSSLKYETFCAQGHFPAPQGHSLPTPGSTVELSSTGSASLTLESDTEVGSSVSLFSLFLPAAANQGIPWTSLPAGLTASLSLLNSKQDICSHNPGTDASGWLWENALEPSCCDARCITHLNSLPVEKELFHPSAKRQSENQFANKETRRNTPRKKFKEREGINSTEEKQDECDTWKHIFHKQYCHCNPKNKQMKDSCLGLPKTANYREILAEFSLWNVLSRTLTFKRWLKGLLQGKINCSQNNLEKPRLNKTKWISSLLYWRFLSL